MGVKNDNMQMSDEIFVALSAAREFRDDVGIKGYGIAFLYEDPDQLVTEDDWLVDPETGLSYIANPDILVKQVIPFANLVTDKGDEYYVKKGITGISPANPTAPTAVNGMKLGTGTTAAAKSGAGAALVTYLSGSNVAFDATFPSAAAVGTDIGWNASYKTTWIAGVATNAAITEVAIVNDQATNATTTAANTISRAVFAAVNKTALDALAITWNHKMLGA